MSSFQQKVTALRRYESICYTICLSILEEERAACEAAKDVLAQLFGNGEFWHLEETQRSPFIFRISLRICLPRVQSPQLQATV